MSFATVAVNERALEVETEAVEGETETEIDAVVASVMVADALFELLDTEAAVRVTVAGFGTVAGAV